MTIRNKKIHFERLFAGDITIWMILFFLCVTSVIEVYSASSNMTYQGGEFWSPVMRQGILLMVGVTLTWIIHLIPCRYFGWLVIIAPLLSIVLLIAVYSSGEINDTHRFIGTKGFTFQPSELAKGALVIVVAWILSVMRDENGATKQAFKWILIFSVVICGLIAPENLSTAVLAFGVVMMMMWVGMVPWRYFGKLLLVISVTGGLGYAILRFAPESALSAMQDTPLERVSTWSHRIRNHTAIPDDPAQYDLSTNPQITQSHIAVATCNVIGRAPGNSRVRDFLPQAYSDFIFAIIIEEMGIEGAIIVLLLYVGLLYRVVRISRKCQKNFPAYLIMGLALLITSQALVNMAVAVGLFPVTGQTLPLISRGGSSIMVNCVYFGMMLSISRTAQKVGDVVPKDK